MPYRSRTVAVLVLAVVMLTLHGGWESLHAQGLRPHDWDYPFCGEQPIITQVFDHKYPILRKNETSGQKSTVILYSGDEMNGCILGTGHEGWDYAARRQRQGTRGTSCDMGILDGMRSGGSYVYAAQSGTVRLARWDTNVPGFNPGDPSSTGGLDQGYGLHVVVKHDDNTEAVYSHLGALWLEEGNRVNKGDLVGAVGSTGGSTGPHLHFGAARGDIKRYGMNPGWQFDPYGWTKNFDGLEEPPPSGPDPWETDGGHHVASTRVILPAADDNEGCPDCTTTVVVQEDSPGVQYSCTPGSPGCGWHAASGGTDGQMLWTEPNGHTERDWIRYVCSACSGSGVYAVDVYDSSGGNSNSHVVRYELPFGFVAIVDQDREDVGWKEFDGWRPIGIYSYDGDPWVKLSDNSGRYATFYAASPQRIGADAVRFRKCVGGGKGVPTGGGGGGQQQ